MDVAVVVPLGTKIDLIDLMGVKFVVEMLCGIIEMNLFVSCLW